jgi:hypothetical protein
VLTSLASSNARCSARYNVVCSAPHTPPPPGPRLAMKASAAGRTRETDASDVRERCAGQGKFVAKYLRVLIEQDRDPTGNWTAEPGMALKALRPDTLATAHNVHTAGQLTLLMDMFLAPTPPKLDFLGFVEKLDLDWNRTLQAYRQYNGEQGVLVDSDRYTPKPVRPHAAAYAAPGRKSHDLDNMWSVLHRDPQLLCDAARMLEFDYECLPMYNIDRWCGGNASHPIS